MSNATAIFDAMTDNPEWGGYGYLGERRVGRTSAHTPEAIAAMDEATYQIAEAQGLTDAELFEWANSRDGRWWADMTITGLTVKAAPVAPRRVTR